MGKWVLYLRSTTFSYFLSIFLIAIRLKFGTKVSRTAKVTLEILEHAFKNKDPFRIKNNILIIDSKINQQKRKFHLRWMTSDILVFKQIIIQKELEPIYQIFKSVGREPKVVIDAGANIGLSSMFIRAYYPSASLICIEPNKENSAMIYKNLGYSNFQLIEKALWHQRGYLEEEVSDGAWGIKMVEIEEDINGAIESTTLTDIMKQFKLDNIDYLKIDIEGAEEHIFYQDHNIGQVLEKVTCISIEPHSLEFEKFIIQYLRDAGFQVSQSGELVIGFK
jgi:FkbM family methyltransferase